MSIPKWAQKMIDKGVSLEIVKERIEKRKANDREWAKLNADKKREHKKAYKDRLKKREEEALNPPPVERYEGSVIPSAYHADWRQMPTYRCPELTYRGQA